MIRPLEEILTYENKWVVERFLKTSSWFKGTDEEAYLIFEDLKRFLWLCAITEKNKKENPAIDFPDIGFANAMLVIDEMWHSFILNTSCYTHFCASYLGSYIHHPTPIEKYVANEKSVGQSEAKEIFVSELLECVYENFGEEVTIRWFDEYFRFAPLVG